MFIFAAHNHQHVLPALAGGLALFGSLGLGVCLVLALKGRWHRAAAALLTISLASVSYAWLKHESDIWWNRRCLRGDPDGQATYTKAGCGDAPPLVPFTAAPSD